MSVRFRETQRIGKGKYMSVSYSAGEALCAAIVKWIFYLAISPVLWVAAAIRVLVKRHKGDFSMTLWEKFSFYTCAVVFFPIPLGIWAYKWIKKKLLKYRAQLSDGDNIE